MLSILGQHGDGDRVCIAANGQVWTAADLLEQAGLFARALVKDACGPRILLMSSDRWEFLVALLGTWLAGRTVVLPPNGQPELLRTWAAAHGPVEAIGQSGEVGGKTRAQVLATVACDRCPIDLVQVRNDLAALNYRDDRPLVTVWTSGTSGEHQAYDKSALQLLGEATLQAQTFGFAGGEVVVSSVPAHHIYGLLFGVLVPLLAGGVCFAGTPLLPQEIAAVVASQPRMSLVSVPAHLRALSILPAQALAGVRRIFSSGAPLPPATAQNIEEHLGGHVVEVFGSTETGGIAWRRARVEATTWQAFAAVKIDVDAEGLLLIDSPFLAASLAKPWRSADRVDLRGSGQFDHLGREDGVVKVAGKRVALAEVAQRLLQIPGVIDAAVVAVPSAGVRGQEVAAIVVAPGCGPLQLRQALHAWLDPVVIPRRFRFVDALPRTEAGKTTRAALLELLTDHTHEAEHVQKRWTTYGDGVGSGAFYVPRNFVHFRGHFPGYPVVAAFVQLDLLCALVRDHFAGQGPSPWGSLRRLMRLKFKRPLRPGDEVTYNLTKHGDDRIDFAFTVDGRIAASGTLEFANVKVAARPAVEVAT